MAKAPVAETTTSGLGRLARGAATYLFATFVTRGLSLLLIPVYTRVMSPDDYGIVGLSMSLYSSLGIVLGMSAHSAPSRLYYSYAEEDRRRLVGTVLSFLLVVPFILAGCIDLVGRAGLVKPFATVPYAPYLSIVVWSSAFTLLSSLAVNVLVVREAHRTAATLNSGIAVATLLTTVLLVVHWRMGAKGQLLAGLLTNVLAGGVAVALIWPFGRPCLDGRILKQALLFSLPLVPHELSKWVIAASDRILLERWVSTAELGCYALANTLAATVGIVTGAVGSALFPIVQKHLAEGDPRSEVPFLGSAVVVGCGAAAVVAAVELPPLVELITPPVYHRAGSAIPFLVLGFFFQALYGVWAQGTFFKRRSGVLASVTIAGAVVNGGLNLLLVPRFGMIAAAVNTAIGYAVMAVAHAWAGDRLLPIRWEYGRVARVLLAGAATVILAALFHAGRPIVTLAIRSLVLAVAFPALLVAFRGVRPAEVRRAREVLARRRKTARS